jgi:polysaccharide deacetylase 2 family uncharacterized protein YibQ
MAKKRSSRSKGGMPAPVVFVAVALVLLAIVYFMKGGQIGVLDKSAALDKRLGAVYSKFGLDDSDVTSTETEEKKLGEHSYIHTRREYKASRNVSLKSFESALKARLKGTEFRVAKSNILSGKMIESGTFLINRGDMDMMTLRLVKPAVAPTPKPAPPEVTPKEIIPKEIAVIPPVPAKKARGPRIAIVIDDFGYSMSNMPTLLAMKQPVTLSILPNLKYSKEVARQARSKGDEIILHLPMESLRKSAKEEAGTIKTGLSKKEILSRLDSELAGFTGLSGVSNHQGSKATEDRFVMTTVFTRLKEKDLFFLDSFTSSKSVCKDVAASIGEKFAKRDVFLDNSSDPEDIKKQFLVAKKMAMKNGSAIAICHDRKSSIKVLSEIAPQMEKEGVSFVYLSELVK